MKKTYREVNEFSAVATAYTMQHADSDTKFKYALTRMLKQIRPLLEDLQERLSDLNVEFAATDRDEEKNDEGREPLGILLTDERGQFRYTKKGLIARNKAHRAVMHEDVEIEPYYASDIPELTDSEREVFTGFVLRAEKSEAAQ